MTGASEPELENMTEGVRDRKGEGVIAGHTYVQPFISDFVRSWSLLPISCQISGILWESRHLHLRGS